MIYKNLSSCRTRWIEKMASYNFTIYYQPEVKMGHADFTLWMNMFLSKNSTNVSTSILRVQKLSEYIQPKWTRISIIKSININQNKKQKSNPMIPLRKVEYIRKKKTHNGHYCTQYHIYYQGYNHKCLISQYYDSSLIISEGGG